MAFNATSPRTPVSVDPTVDTETAINREDTVQTLATSSDARKQRTIVLSLLFLVFFALTIPYFVDNVHRWCRQSLTFNAAQHDLEAQCISAEALLLWASILCVVATVAVVVAMYFPSLFSGRIANLSGCALMFGGFLYLIGWIFAIVVARDSEEGWWDSLSAEDKRWKNCIYTWTFAEALLVGGSVILLGLDSTYFRIYESPFHRLMTNWKLLGWASIIGGMAYALRPADSDGDQLQAQCPGFLIIFFTLCIQSVNVLCCNLELTRCARIVYGVMMVFGAITVAVGYLQELDNGYNDSPSLKARLFGIASFVVGITAFWAFDFWREMPAIPGKENDEIQMAQMNDDLNGNDDAKGNMQSEANL